jgi:isopenicillin N synthase-like dioxygenase
MSITPALIADAIPLLDVSGYLAGDDQALRGLAAELRWAFENVGFYYLRGHGIDRALLDATYDAAARFHAQPIEKKLAVRTDEHNIGYLPMANGQTAYGGRPSRNDAYFLRRERRPDDPHVLANRRFHVMNRWPDALPGFRETTLAYMRALERLCQRLVPIYAVALDMPADTFDAAYTEPHIILRMSHYPPLDDDADDVSLVPHTDSGFMTLLAPNPVPGLSIQLPDGRWLDAPGVEDAFVVNGGDILHRWTNERFLSTPHRVVNRSHRDRYAIPFFCDPNHDTVIDCLPTCSSPGNPAKYPAITFGDYAIWFARKSYEHLASRPGPADTAIAPGERATRRW